MLTNCLAACAHLSITVSEIQRDICEKKSAFYHNPLHSTPPLGGFPSEYRHPLWYGKSRMVSLPEGEKNFEDIFIRFGATHERDGQTDRQTPGDGNSRAMHSIARQKSVAFVVIYYYIQWCCLLISDNNSGRRRSDVG